MFHLNDKTKQTVRAEICSIPTRAKSSPVKNIDTNVFKALINVKKDPDRFVLSADKGYYLIVIDKHQDLEKAQSFLNDKQTYTILKSDPAGRAERDLHQR